MSEHRIRGLLSDPPNEYRPVPQWSWNGDLTRERITEQLEQFKAQGCGGLFTHARPGHITGYLTERWFELWEFAAAESERLGLDFHIYDEFMCPGGVAGGNVTAQDPTLIQKELVLRKVGCGDPVSHADVLAWIRLDPDSGAARPAEEENATHEILLTWSATGDGGFPSPDLCRRETTEAFIRLTHERLAETSSHRFGRNVRLMFCDEPMLLTTRQGFPFSRFLVREFRNDHGYELLDNLIPLCFATDGAHHVRHDFWWTVNRLFNRNFMQPLNDWCEKHELLFTGHLMEHEWPWPNRNPDCMAGLRWMQAPGEDLLGFQYAPTDLTSNALYVMNLKELSSLVNQLDREWCMVETSGAAGYGAAFELFKPCEDLALAFGVNVIDPHLSHQTVAGMRKYDWPQTLSDHSPWWQRYRMQADHVSRVNAVLSQGREVNRVLVLHPTTSGWLHYTGPSFDPGDQATVALEQLRTSQTQLVAALYGAQIDFDLGDEFILEEFGRVANGRLVVGAREYDAVVMPSEMETVTDSTLRLLLDFSEVGGRLYSLRSAPALVNGRPTDSPAALERSVGWTRVADCKELVEKVRKHVIPYVSFPDGSALPGGIIWRRAVCDDGVIWFFCNPWQETIECDVRLPAAVLRELDTGTAEIRDLPSDPHDGWTTAPLRLLPRGHRLLLGQTEEQAATWTPQAPIEAAPRESPATVAVPLALIGIERVTDNLLFVDYCDVEAYGASHTDINTAAADTLNWRWQGFDGNPWHKQFRRTVIEQRSVPYTEVLVRYRFTVAKGLADNTRNSLAVCVERPWLYTVSLNGITLDADAAEKWFDEDMRRLSVGHAVKEGENELLLRAQPFHVLCEIMPVYVCGDFGLTAAARGYDVGLASPLGLGDWTQQGAPFYPGVVRYRYAFTLAQDAARLCVRVPEWRGAVAVVYLDGEELGPTPHPPFEVLSSSRVPAGSHELAIDVYGNMKNMMGSHHHDNLPLRWTYECAPDHMPPGADYQLQPTGLLTEPQVAARAAPCPTT